MAVLKRFERAFNSYREHRMAICATLNQSLSPDIQSESRSSSHTIQNQRRSWMFEKIYQRIHPRSRILGCHDPLLISVQIWTHMQYFQTTPSSWTASTLSKQDIQRMQIKFHFGKILRPIVMFKLLKTMKNSETIWIRRFIQNVNGQITRKSKLEDLKTPRIYQDPNLETNVNADQTGPCFNCKCNHWSKNCRKEPIVRHKCGRKGHLQEFFNRASSYSTGDDGQHLWKTYERHSAHHHRSYNKGPRKTNDQGFKKKRIVKTATHFLVTRRHAQENS